jgi:hypothetical protein
MSDDAWAPPESDFQAVPAQAAQPALGDTVPTLASDSWKPPESDFAPATPFQDAWGQIKHQGGQLAKAAINTVAAVPMMAEDAGVGVANLASGLTGTGYDRYTYPSDTLRQATNQVFGAPQNTVEKVNDAVLPMIMSAGTASEGAPAALRSLMAPAAETQATAGFVSPTDAKKQLLAQTIKKGQDLGLVVPPQTTNPNALNATIETVGGKIATQQGASVHNQPIANALAAKELGLNPDAPITEGALRGVIADAGKGYQAVRNVGQIPTDQTYLETLSDVAAKAAGPATSFPGSKPNPLLAEVDSLLQPSFNSSHAVDKIAELRDSSSTAYRQGESQVGAGYRTLANALEDQIDSHIAQNPSVPQSTVANFRASRQLAAKAHSVMDALNPATGDVSIQGLARSGDPLSGNLRILADFGNAVPRATQDVSKIGSHGVSHLDTVGTMMMGALGEHTAGAYGMALGATYPAARWGARAYALGPGQAGALPSVATTAGSPKTANVIAQGLGQVQRASGGKVDDDALVQRLVNRWKAAKKATDATTKPLLHASDTAIAKALEIAGAHI